MAATVKCDTIVNASSATNNLALDASGNVTVGAGLTLTGGALNVGGSVGSAGQILKSNGTTSSWVNGWTLINTVTGSGVAALQDTTSLTSTYAQYKILVRNILPATNAVTLALQLYSGGAYKATNYAASYFAPGGTATGSNTATFINLSYANRASGTYQAAYEFTISNPSSTTVYKPIFANAVVYDTASIYYTPLLVSGGWIGGTGAITGFQIYASSGNVAGTVEVWGSN